MKAGETAVEVVERFLVIIAAIEVGRKIKIAPIVEIVQTNRQIQILFYLTKAFLTILSIEEARG